MSTDVKMQHKKPAESAFKQQRLPAWQPILTAGTVLPTFFVVGIAFVPIGVGVLYFSSQVMERVVDYTYCRPDMNITTTCADVIGDNRNMSCTCDVPFYLDTDYAGQVFIHYGLTNFYQNHRRYVKSRDDVQLLGKLSDSLSSDCSPYMYADVNGTKKPIAPCGAIANSLFSDELSISFKSKTLVKVPFIRKGIAWPSDKQIKFRNPPIQKNRTLKEAFEGYAKPIDWKKNIWELDPDDIFNNGFENEDFIVWMRTAALPNFRKLYRLVNHSHPVFKDGLPKGDYILHVVYSFPVSGFKGTKSLVVSTTSALGGKNPFLGITYIITGSICILVGISFLVIHIKYGKGTAEVVNVTPTTSFQ